MTTLNVAVPGTSTTAPLGYAMPDAILRWISGDQGFCLDLASPECFAEQADPTNGAALVNFANVAATRDGSVTKVAGITYTGGGLYFGGVTAPGNYVSVPNAFEAIQADADKAWMAVLWVKFPAAADWPAAGVGRALAAAGNYSSAPDLFTYYITTNGSSKDIVIRPQTAVGSATAILLSGAGATFGGKVCQVLVWRTAAGITTVRIKSADGSATVTSTPVTLAANSGNLSGLTWRFGTMASSMTASNFSASGSWGANDIGACKHTFYRAMIASTARLPSTVSPLTIADSDYTYTVARAVYS